MYKNGTSRNCKFALHDICFILMIKIYKNLLQKWIQVYDQSGKDYRVNNEIRIKTPMLSDAYIVVKGIIAVTDPDDAKRNKGVAFKNNVPFISCISKINGAQIDNAEDLDVVMPMFSLLEYSKNYTKSDRKFVQLLQR